MRKTTKISIILLSLASVTALSQIYISMRSNAKVKKESSYQKVEVLSQENLNGTWYWESGNQSNTTELYLVQNGNTVIGKHCSSFFNGSKTDCVEEDVNSIQLNMVAPNVYEGTLSSGFSEALIPIRITLNPTSETIQFKQLSQPFQEYYLPDNVTMTLAQE